MLSNCKSENPDFCTYHMTINIKQKLDYAKNILRKAKGRSAVLEAQKDIERLMRLYNATPEGIRKLKEQIVQEKNKGDKYPLQLEEKLRIAKLDFSKRKSEYLIEKFEQNQEKVTPEMISQLFKNTKYIVNNVNNEKQYFELYNGSKEYSTSHVLATITKTKGEYVVSAKNSINEPNILAQTFASTDNQIGDIVAVKKALINLRREAEKEKASYDHRKYILSDARKYGVLILSKTILVNNVLQKHYIFYSKKNIPYAIYRIDDGGMFIEGYGALGKDKIEHITNAWTFREWLKNYQNTERRLPKQLVEEF